MNKILIIEDDKTICEALQMYLQDAGYETKTVMDGLRGYLHSNIWEPDLILMDIFMPHGNGTEVARDIIDTHIPIIFMTASDKKGLEEETKKFNTVGFFKKPLEMPKLMDKIKCHCGKKCYHKEKII